MSSNPPIRLRGVTYRIGDAVLVRDLSFEVRRSETVVLVGRSGSGKTTTLRLVNHTLMPTRGEVTVESRRTSDWDPIRLRRRIGYVIQDVGLFPHFTVARNIALIPSLEGWGADRIEARTH